ncbi:hypothetical protein RJ639_024819 [Escallonia herrerae]|uniref:Uncharacterized protein n=1 Tax=Escallonia herrerae TaxID=1293975 RepID=A0AA88UTK5_9ASTE|nr:hypothetical protein RJ639_024819 [Escallonia herrerae]
MDHKESKQTGYVVDLESGVVGCQEEKNIGHSSGNRRTNNMLTRLPSGVLGFHGSAKGECSSMNLLGSLGQSSEVPCENLELVIDKSLGGHSGEVVPLLEEKKHMKEKRKMTNSTKAAKPPRPPKGPVLGITDLKLVKEMSEFAAKKRARIERMKALKQMKISKPASSSSISSLSAMVVTLLFCLVIFFQGICSKNSESASFPGSPEPAASANGLISVQLYNNFLTSDGAPTSSESPKCVFLS